MKSIEILNGKKVEAINKKDTLGKKLDHSWRAAEPIHKKVIDSKKLMIKLETNGNEKRKILLKLESDTSNVQNGNFSLISELLKEFFKNEEKE